MDTMSMVGYIPVVPRASGLPVNTESEMSVLPYTSIEYGHWGITVSTRVKKKPIMPRFTVGLLDTRQERADQLIAGKPNSSQLSIADHWVVR